MVRGWSVVVAALLIAPILGGCSSDDPKAAPPARVTPLSKLDVTSVRLARAEFCDRVPTSAVRRALGADPATDASWGNGDPVDGEGGTGDIGHEIGCSWTGPGGSAARAWVFARPITAVFAAALVRRAGHESGCTAEPAKILGSPAVLQSCTPARGVHRLRRAGLFGETWLTCEVSGPAAGLQARTDAWCAQVVAALDAP
jgi:hypothetical protein